MQDTPPNIPKLSDFSLPDISGADGGYVEPPPPRPYVKPIKPKPVDEDAETLGFITNLPKSVLKMTKEVFVDFPIAVGTAAAHYYKNPMDWDKDFRLFLNKPGDTGDVLRRSITDYYTNNLWKNFNDDPARALADVAALADGIGMLGRASGAARAAEVAAKAEKAGHAAMLSNTAKTVANVGRATEAVSDAAHYIDPLRATATGAGFLFKKGLRAIGYGKLTPEIADAYNHFNSREALNGEAFTADELKIPLDDTQKEELFRLLNLGDTAEASDIVRKGGPVAERYRLRREKVAAEEEYILNNHHMFGYASKEEALEHFQKAKAKAVEHWTGENLDLPISHDQALQMIKDGTLDPTYNTMFRESNGKGVDLWELVNGQRAPGKTLGRSEERIANGEYIKDVDVIAARQTKAFHQVKAKLDFLSWLKERLTAEGEILVGSGPEMEQAAKNLGYRELPEAFYKWYYESFNKGSSVLVNELKSAVKAGLSEAQTLAKLREKWMEAFATGAIDEVATGGKVFVPDYVAAWVAQEFSPVTKLEQVYGKWQSRYKSMATVFNPRYWAPVLFGNTLAAVMYGLSPDMLKLALRYRGDLPPALKPLIQNEIWLRDLNFFDRKAKTFGEAASRLDNIYKQGMFANELLKDSYVRSRLALKTFFHSEETIAQVIKHFGAAPEREYATMVKIGELNDSVANIVIRSNKEYRRLKRLEDRLTNEMAKLSMYKDMSLKELEIGLDARKDKLAKMLSGVQAEGINPTDALKYLNEAKAKLAEFKKRKDLFQSTLAFAWDDALHLWYDERPGLKKYNTEVWDKLSEQFNDPGLEPIEQVDARLGEYWKNKSSTPKPAMITKSGDPAVLSGVNDPKLQMQWIDYLAHDPHPVSMNQESLSGGAVYQLRDRLKRYSEWLHSNWVDPNLTEWQFEERIQHAQSILGQSRTHFKYTYFVEKFLEHVQQLKSTLKNDPTRVDVSAVLQSVDNAIQVVEKGRPDLLRYVVKQMKKAVDGTSPMMVRRSRLSLLTDMVGKAEDRVKTLTAEAIDKMAQSGKLDKLLPGLAQDRAAANRAIQVGNMFFGSIDNLLPFERRIIKQIIPFYTFTKAMTSLAFRFPFLYPKRSFIYSHLARAWNDIMDDDDAFMPSWTKNYVPVMFHEDSSVTMVRAGSLSPFSNVKMNGLGGHNVMPNVYDVMAQNPFVRVFMDMKGGTPEWSARPLSPGNKAVRMDNGEVYEFTGKGFRRIIAQPGILKSVAGLFPQSQLIDQLLHGYAQTDRGWLFSPEPYLSPSGEVRFPKELIDRILSIGVPTTTVDPGQLNNSERVRVYRIVKEFQREARSASPERRESLLESLRSWSNSRKRAINRDED